MPESIICPAPLFSFARSGVSGHPWDDLSEVTDSLVAVVALAGNGHRLRSELSDAEQRGYFSLLGRLAAAQTELVAALLPVRPTTKPGDDAMERPLTEEEQQVRALVIEELSKPPISRAQFDLIRLCEPDISLADAYPLAELDPDALVAQLSARMAARGQPTE
jgi:hypothetical protein